MLRKSRFRKKKWFSCKKNMYINRNEPVLCKWNWQYPRGRIKKLERYWKIWLRKFCFSLITFCTSRNQGGLFSIPLFPFVAFPFASISISKNRFSSRYRWWRIRIFLIRVKNKALQTLRSGNYRHWQNVWEKLNISCKLLF